MSDLGDTSAPTGTNTSVNEEHTDTIFIQQKYQNKMYSCEFTWTIPNFKIYYGTKLYSQPFSPRSHNYEWVLSLGVPRHDRTNDCITLHLNPVSGCDELFGHTSGNVQVGLVSVQGEKTSIQNDAFNTATKNYSWQSAVQMTLANRRHLLEATNESLLPQGALSIFCHLSFVILNDAAGGKQSRDFEKLFNDRESSDLTINVDGNVYPAHKFVLAAHSPVFEAMFAHDTMESQQSRVDIKDVDEKVFAEMLRFMYMGYVENLQAIAFDLAIAADKYNIEKLRCICEWKFGESVTAETAAKALISSELYNLREAKKRIIRYMIKHMKEVMKSKILNDLGPYPKLFIDVINCLHERNIELEAELQKAYQNG